MKNNAGFQTIALTRIHESTTNPRRIFDESKLAEFAASLRTQGLIRIARTDAFSSAGYAAHQARLMLDSAHREFLRKTIPWTIRPPRTQ